MEERPRGAGGGLLRGGGGGWRGRVGQISQARDGPRRGEGRDVLGPVQADGAEVREGPLRALAGGPRVQLGEGQVVQLDEVVRGERRVEVVAEELVPVEVGGEGDIEAGRHRGIELGGGDLGRCLCGHDAGLLGGFFECAGVRGRRREVWGGGREDGARGGRMGEDFWRGCGRGKREKKEEDGMAWQGAKPWHPKPGQSASPATHHVMGGERSRTRSKISISLLLTQRTMAINRGTNLSHGSQKNVDSHNGPNQQKTPNCY